MEINYPYRKQTKLNTFKINLTKISKSYGVNDRRKHLKTGIIV